MATRSMGSPCCRAAGVIFGSLFGTIFQHHGNSESNKIIHGLCLSSLIPTGGHSLDCHAGVLAH